MVYKHANAHFSILLRFVFLKRLGSAGGKLSSDSECVGFADTLEKYVLLIKAEFRLGGESLAFLLFLKR